MINSHFLFDLILFYILFNIMDAIKILFSNHKKRENLDKINKLSLKERKQQVINELKNETLNLDKLDFLMLMDNTNEDLLYRYIESINQKLFFQMMQKYSSYMCLSKIKDLKDKSFKNNIQGYRNFSYKTLLFNLLSAIKKDDLKIMDQKLAIIKINEKNSELNNQPFDLQNFEAFYYHLCDLLLNQIEKQKKGDFNEYLKCLKTYIASISNILDEYQKDEYNEEKKDIKKFLTIIFSIINLDVENSHRISQVAVVFEQLSDKDRGQMISVAERQIKNGYGNLAVEDFKKIIENKKIYSSINNINNIIYLKNKIEIPEECYSYNYIAENNIFKKYENKIKNLLNVIYKSDLFKQLVKIVYKTENEDMKYFFDEENFVEDFWNKNIIFVPFKIKKVSGFSYKDTFLFFFSIYKIKNFESDIEDEIFTLGAFIRVLIHETFGHLMISYIFYMFYANINDYDSYFTPRMNDQIKELNKQKLCEFIGNFLAQILYDNLYNTETKDSTSFKKIKESEKLFNDSMKKKLCEKFEPIIGKEYAEKLITKLEESPEKQFSEIDNKNNLPELSKKIVDILIDLISEEFNKYIYDLKYKQEKYKEIESGNFVEFLLFNDFNQYMTLKECLFLLDEEIYMNTNFIKFRSNFKNLIGKNNDDFLKELDNGKKIFSDLFSKYNAIYIKKNKTSNDFVTAQNFRGGWDDNLNKKIEAFGCFNFKRSRFDSGK